MKNKFLLAASLLLYPAILFAQRSQENPRLKTLNSIVVPQVLKDSLIKLENSTNEVDLELLATYYRGKRDAEKIKYVADLITKRFPNGKAAYEVLYDRIYEGRDPAENEKIYKEMMQKFSANAKYNLDGPAYYVAKSFLGKNKPEKVREYLALIQNPEKKTNSYSYIARESVAAKDTKLGEELIRKTFADLNGDTTHKGMDEFRRILSEVLYANGKYEEGFPHAKYLYDKKSELTGVGMPQLSATYLNYLVSLRKYKEAYPEMLRQLKSGLAGPLIKANFKEAYTSVNGSNAGFEKFAADISSSFKDGVLMKVQKKMINTPAFDFQLKDVSGNTVRLSDYKGKVVVLDFWATWCGPCKAMFPKMQMAVNKYKSDKNVVFLFIHTLENSANPTKAAADYLKDMKYNFNLLMDIKDPVSNINRAAAGYQVTGIPHKVVIDGKGNVRFATTGNNIAGEDAFLEDMSSMIDLAKRAI